MTWMCPNCKTSYARRKDHDESSSNRRCLEDDAFNARVEWELTLGEGGIGRKPDKEVNRAFAKMKAAERKLK